MDAFAEEALVEGEDCGWAQSLQHCHTRPYAQGLW